MRKLIVQEWLSLDGFAEDKNGKLDFFPSTEENKYADQDQLKFLDTVDTILLGRATYQLFVEFWPTVASEKEIIAPRLNEITKIVISNTLKKAPWGAWPEAKIIRGDAMDAIQKLKAQRGKNIVLWGSLSLAQDLTKANLIDEYHLHVCPTAVGGGRRFFDDSDVYKSFELEDTRKYDTGVIFLSYKPK